MKDLRELTVAELTEVTESDAPAPGGGSISALAGALSAALAGMVANLSQGPKYLDVKTEMAQIAEEADRLRLRLLEAMQEDTASFSLYMAALSMPKNTEEEKAARQAAMQDGLKAAALTPLGVAESIVPVFDMVETVISRGNPNAVTDALVAAMMARSGLLGALFNVKVNLASIRDETFVAETGKRLRELEQAALDGEKRAFSHSVFAEHL